MLTQEMLNEIQVGPGEQRGGPKHKPMSCPSCHEAYLGDGRNAEEVGMKEIVIITVSVLFGVSLFMCESNFSCQTTYFGDACEE